MLPDSVAIAIQKINNSIIDLKESKTNRRKLHNIFNLAKDIGKLLATPVIFLGKFISSNWYTIYMLYSAYIQFHPPEQHTEEPEQKPSTPTEENENQLADPGKLEPQEAPQQQATPGGQTRPAQGPHPGNPSNQHIVDDPSSPIVKPGTDSPTPHQFEDRPNPANPAEAHIVDDPSTFVPRVRPTSPQTADDPGAYRDHTETYDPGKLEPQDAPSQAAENQASHGDLTEFTHGNNELYDPNKSTNDSPSPEPEPEPAPNESELGVDPSVPVNPGPTVPYNPWRLEAVCDVDSDSFIVLPSFLIDALGLRETVDNMNQMALYPNYNKEGAHGTSGDSGSFAPTENQPEQGHHGSSGKF